MHYDCDTFRCMWAIPNPMKNFGCAHAWDTLVEGLIDCNLNQKIKLCLECSCTVNYIILRTDEDKYFVICSPLAPQTEDF